MSQFTTVLVLAMTPTYSGMNQSVSGLTPAHSDVIVRLGILFPGYGECAVTTSILAAAHVAIAMTRVNPDFRFLVDTNTSLTIASRSSLSSMVDLWIDVKYNLDLRIDVLIGKFIYYHILVCSLSHTLPLIGVTPFLYSHLCSLIIIPLE